MPDETYLQSWWLDTELNDSTNHSARMHAIATSWGAFIATIAMLKVSVALSGQTCDLARHLAMIFVATNVWQSYTFIPYQGLMDAHYASAPGGNKVRSKRKKCLRIQHPGPRSEADV